MNRRLNPPSEERANLDQAREFARFLQERRADSKREAERLDGEIESLMAQIDSKRREQSEHLQVVDACDGGLTVIDKSNRPAPTLSEPFMRDLTPQHAVGVGQLEPDK